MIKKPTVDEILEIYDKSLLKWQEAGLQSAFREDQRFYELDFKADLNIPKEFESDAVVLPTARDKVDALVDHTDISHARVFVNKKGTTNISEDAADMLRKFALGLIHRTNVESDISPLRISSKHYWLHGLTWIKSIWDADNWLDRPMQKEGESEEEFAKKIDEWRVQTHNALPIIIQAVNPSNIIPDPFHSGKLYVFEVHRKLVYDAKRLPFKWQNPHNKPADSEVEYIEYWDKDYRCVLIDREPVWKIGGGVISHKYGFIPYTAIESGLGNLDIDARPDKRYVGIIRYMKPLLLSQSIIYSMCDILTKRETMKGGYIRGADAGTLGDIKQEYGKYWPVGSKEVEFVDWESKLAPREAYAHLGYITDLIDIHSAPRSMFGVGETGVRSGADRRLVLEEAQAKLRYSKDAFANGWAQILTKCARLVKYVIPGDFEIWTRTPSDEFDVVIKKSLFKEPFNFYVEFAPISEQDEYRRHEDLLRMVQGGLYTKHHARSQLSDVDVKGLEKQEFKEAIRNSPQYMGLVAQHFGAMTQQALAEAGIPMAYNPMGMPNAEQQTVPGRGTPPIPERAQPGSLQEMLNQVQGQYGRPGAGMGQGAGGGGNTMFGV